MATLHIDLKFGLSVEKTRNLLGSYSRGCALESFVRYMPKVEFEGKETKYFDASQSSTLVFLSDHFAKDNPFTVTLIFKDETSKDFEECNMLMLETSNVMGIKITNNLEDTIRAHIIL